MPQPVQVGTILMSHWPQVLAVEGETFSGEWNIVKTIDGSTLDRKIRTAGWNFFFIASEIKVMFFGALGATKIHHALDRILSKVSQQNFNSLEVTGIAAKHFLGLPYAVVSAHSRHVQQSCYLDGAVARRTAQHDAAWARS